MRLINTSTYQFEEIEGEDLRDYAILSHRWQENEVLYKDMINGTAWMKMGYKKIEKLCELAQRAGIQYAWCDTCCIDKSSSAELSEAINSMFNWYRRSSVCYVYLYDVLIKPDYRPDMVSLQRVFLEQFYGSEWFRRSWTLQELLAPGLLEFYNYSWMSIGSRGELRAALTYATGIPGSVWVQGFKSGDYSVAQKLSWAAHRVATRIEDVAYSLWGIFGVNLPLLYGEGEAAFRRLQEEILKQTEDDSFLLHTSRRYGVFAESPSNFACHLPRFTYDERFTSVLSQIIDLPGEVVCRIGEPENLSISHAGLHIERPIFQWCKNVYLLSLRTMRVFENVIYRAHIFVRYNNDTKRLERVGWGAEPFKYLPFDPSEYLPFDLESSNDDSLRSRESVSFGHREVISIYPAEPLVFPREHDPNLQYHVEIACSNWSCETDTFWRTKACFKNILARLCWKTSRHTVAIAGAGDESQAVLQVIRGNHTYYLHIGFNANQILCLVHVIGWCLGDRLSASCFERLRKRPFTTEPHELSLNDVLNASYCVAQFSTVHESSSKNERSCVIAENGSRQAIGIPGVTLLTRLEGRRYTLHLIHDE